MRYGFGKQADERRRLNARLYEVNQRKMALITSARMKIRMIGNKYCIGRKDSPQTRAKRNAAILKALTGVPWTEERRQARSVAYKGVPKPPRSVRHNINQSIAQRGIKKPAISESNRRRIGMKYNKKPGR
jgi:hypothetical protein